MNYKRVFAIQEANKKRWLKVNDSIINTSGIYILTRVDENGIKYAYVGQAKHILDRLAQHLSNYQHIDLSLKKHGLFNKDKNVYGWNVSCIYTNDLDDVERQYIRLYADKGYQLRNKTLGGQNKGKNSIDDKEVKGYRKGVENGYKKAFNEIKLYFNKYLDIVIKGKSNKIKVRKYNELLERLKSD